MAAAGQGVKEIARELNGEGVPSPKGSGWGKGQIHRLLTNEAYTGTLIWGAEGKYHRDTGIAPVRVEGAFAPLIDPATFQRVRDLLRTRAPAITPPGEAGSPHLLSGLLRCGGCGARMFGHLARTRGHRYVYYVCATAYRQGRASCSMKSLPRQVIRRSGTSEHHYPGTERGKPEGVGETHQRRAVSIAGWSMQKADTSRRREAPGGGQAGEALRLPGKCEKPRRGRPGTQDKGTTAEADAAVSGGGRSQGQLRPGAGSANGLAAGGGLRERSGQSAGGRHSKGTARDAPFVHSLDSVGGS